MAAHSGRGSVVLRAWQTNRLAFSGGHAYGGCCSQRLLKGNRRMLAMTDSALEAISALTSQDGPDGEGAAGLRFAVQAQDDSTAQLALSVVPGPEEGDQVLGTEGGARIFLDAQAASFLDDKVLDVQQDDQGRLAFAVVEER